MRVEEMPGGAPPERIEPLEEIVIVVEPAAGIERPGLVAEREAMHPDAAASAGAAARAQPTLIDELIEERDRAQLRKVRGVGGHLVRPACDLARSLGKVLAGERIDLHDQQVLGRARADE